MSIGLKVLNMFRFQTKNNRIDFSKLLRRMISLQIVRRKRMKSSDYHDLFYFLISIIPDDFDEHNVLIYIDAVLDVEIIQF